MLSPQQSLFAEYYFSPKSETFSNALQSALKAGYTRETAENITGDIPKWFSELLGKKKRLVIKAEKVLEDSLEWEEKNLRLDSAKFIAKTIGKDEGYSDRVEHTGKDGEQLTVNVIQYGRDNNPI